MYNPKDTQFVGKHDFDEHEARKWANMSGIDTFSVNIFCWVLKSSGKGMKPSKSVVRVKGPVESAEKVFHQAAIIVNLLDAGEWDGRKTVTVR